MVAAGGDVATAPTQASEGVSGLGALGTLASGVDVGAGATSPLPVIARETYELLGEHGRGGLGRIVRARDRRTGRIVAIKEMLADRAAAGRRFRREAIVTANLQHPAIVPVYEVGQWPDGAPFYAMKLVEGRSLDRVIADAITEDDRLALLPHMVAVADAIAYAHDRGYLHRDLKPANVLVGDFGETVVIDWGLAKRIEAAGARDHAAAHEGGAGSARAPELDSDLDPELPGANREMTRAGALLGTPVFMSPEQAAGEPLDRRADVYALGAMLYQLLGGKVPYAASVGATVISDVLRGPPTPLAQLAPRTPRELLAIVGKAMAREPAARYATAGDLAAELRRFLTGQLVRAHAYTRWQRLARFARRHRVILAASAITLGVVAAVTAFSYARVTDERDRARAGQREAELARGAAQRHLAALHLELGRRELFEGKPPRALPHLIESARLGGMSAGLRLLAGRAAESLAPVRASYWADGLLTDVQRPVGRPEWLLATTAGTVVRIAAADGRELMRARAPGNVTDLDLDEAGAALVSSGDATVTWDARSGAERARLTPTMPLVRFAIAGDGLRAHGFHDGAVELWPAGATTAARRWPAHPVDLRDFHLTRDGARLITTDDNFDGALWDTATGTALVRFRGIASIAPDGSFFAHIPSTGDATLRRVRDGGVITTLPGTRDQRDVFVGEGGVVITLGRDGVVASWRPDGAPIAQYPGHTRTLMVVASTSKDGAWLVTGDEQGVVRLFDLVTGALHARFDQGRGTIYAVQIADDASWVSAVSRMGEVTTWDVPRPHPAIGLAGHGDEVRRLAYTDDGATVFTAGRDGMLAEWDAATGAPRRRVAQAHDGAITWVEVAPAGDRVATAGKDGVVTLWDRELRVVQQLRGAGSLAAVHFLPDERVLLGRDAGTAEIWDLRSGQRICSTPPAAELMNTVVAPSQDWFVAYHQGGEGRRYATADCAAGAVYATDMIAAVAVRITADQRLVILAGLPPAAARASVHGVQVFDATSGERVQVLGAPSDGHISLALAADGARVAAGAMDGKVRIWSVADGSLLRELSGGTALIAALTFADDDTLVAGGDDDGTVRIWDQATGELVAAEHVLGGGIYFARLRPDSSQLAVAGLAHVPQLITLPRWAGSVAELSALARCRVPWQLEGSGLVAREPTRADCPP